MPHRAVPTHLTSGSTRRLRLRPVTDDDVDLVHEWCSDPASFAHAPFARHTSIGQTREILEEWVQAWRAGGPSYWIAQIAETAAPIGFGGVRRTESGLNLAYRLGSSMHGQGYGSELACAAVAFAAEWCPDEDIFALIRPANTASARTAARAGLWLTDERTGEDDLPDGAEPSHIYRAPTLRAGTVGVEPGSTAYEEMLDLWRRVNDAGGSVGFELGAARKEVAAVFDGHLRQCHAGQADLVRLVHPASGELLGAGFWTYGSSAKVAHVGTLKRVMVDPDRQRHNLGRILMGRMHAFARARGIELARLEYRGGTGVQRFYEACGYQECGRLPGGLRFSFGDRDEVMMARRLDGHPL